MAIQLTYSSGGFANNKGHSRLDISINDQYLPDYDFIECCLTEELLKPIEFRFTMRKKSLSKSASELDFDFRKELLGAKVKSIMASDSRDENQEKTDSRQQGEFTGIIFNVSLRRDTLGAGIVYECVAYSLDYLLMDGPHCFSFEKMSLKEIVEETLKGIKDTKGDPIQFDIDTGIDDEALDTIPYTVQYNESRHQFLCRLAQRYAQFFYMSRNRLYFGKMPQSGPVLQLYPNVDILSYRFDLKIEDRKTGYAIYDYFVTEDEQSWGYGDRGGYKYDSDIQKTVSEIAFNLSFKPSLHDTHCSTREHYGIQTNASSDMEGESENNKTCVANMRYKNSRSAICRGISNRTDLVLGGKIVIKEHADAGDAVELHENEKMMVIRLKTSWNCTGHYEREFTAMCAEDTLPPYADSDVFPMAKPQHAVVMDNADPEGLGRVRVQFHWQDLLLSKNPYKDETAGKSLITPWIRIAQPHGGDAKGSFVVPEIGDEVMVDFEYGNAEKPFVVGTLYHGTQKPDENWQTDNNEVKAFRTRSGHTVEIHDKDGDGGYIKIYDSHTNNYVLTFSTDDKLIRLESSGNIELSAGNDIVLKAKNNIQMEAEKDFLVESGNDSKHKAGNDYKVYIGDSQTGIHIKDDLIDLEVHGDEKVVSIDSSKGILCKSDSKISFEGKQGASINSGGNLALSAGGNAELSGSNVSVKSKAECSIKGALIKIN